MFAELGEVDSTGGRPELGTENEGWGHENVWNFHVELENFKRTPTVCSGLIRNFILSLNDIQLKVLQAQMLGWVVKWSFKWEIYQKMWFEVVFTRSHIDRKVFGTDGRE